MRSNPLRPGARVALTALLLAAFALRALIPAGYMPSTDVPFTLEICPTGFPAQLLHDHAGGHHNGHDGSHPGDPSVFAHCVFGSATASGPASQIPSLTVLRVEIAESPRAVAPAIVIARRWFQIQQPRAPPLVS